jgi:hypothetical protein
MDWNERELSEIEIAGRRSVSADLRHLMVFKCAVILSLINEPRRVITAEADGMDWTRQYRKAVQRTTGKAAQAYSKVRWEVGGEVRARIEAGADEAFKMPLHWCRAHWRKADAEMANAVWLASMLDRPAGYYLWVKDCWKGHPAYGLKLQDHEPRMIGERDAASCVERSVPSAAKLAAMSAQQRAMMVQAGFVPSGALH